MDSISLGFRLAPSFGYWYIGKGVSTTLVDGRSSPGSYAIDAALGAFYVVNPCRPSAFTWTAVWG